MKLSPMLERALVVALVIAGGLLWFSWRAALRNQAQLSATLASKNEVIADDRGELAKLNDDLAAKMAAIRRDKDEAKTPAQILAKLPTYLPLPQKLELLAGTSPQFLRDSGNTALGHQAVAPSNKSGAVEPANYGDVPRRNEFSRFEDGDAPISGSQKPPVTSPSEEIAPAPHVDIPEPDLKPLFDFSADCKACQITVAQQKEAIRLLGQEVDALKAERDAAVKASRGGGFWSRVKSNAHWFAVGGAFAAGAICASGHCK